MWAFKKVPPPLNDLPRDGSWSLCAVDPEEAKTNHIRLCDAVTTGHEVQFMIQPDPKWTVFSALRGDAG